VLYFFTENGIDVAENEWRAADQASSKDTAHLMARANQVALAASPNREAAPDLYDHNVGLWMYVWGAYEIFYGIRRRPGGDDVTIVGFAPTANHAAVDAEMHRRAALI
jgi:hypothetical protein